MDCGLKMHGSGSRETEAKKSFKVEFRPRYDGLLSYDVFGDGITEYASLVLRAGEDASRSLIREELFVSLAAEACPELCTQKGRYCALYINGEFFGIYCLKEAYSQEYYAVNRGVSPESVTMLRVPAVYSSELYQLMTFAQTNDLTQEDNYSYLEERISFESLIDWCIFESYGGNSDIVGNIRYFKSTEGDGKWRWALYDLDWTFYVRGNSFKTTLESGQQHSILARALLRNAEFRGLFQQRLDALLGSVLSDESVIARIDEYEAELLEAMPREREKWGGTVESWLYYMDTLREFAAGRAEETRRGFTALLNSLGIW